MDRMIKLNVGNRTIQVADIKKRQILNVIDAAKDCVYIDRVILFGSCISERCTEQSDIDIAIFGNATKTKCMTSKAFKEFTHKLYRFDDHNQKYDILYYRSGSRARSAILDEIERGVLVYERT